MTESGAELRNNNEKIVKFINLLRRQRDEMNYLIAKQQEEKHKIENEIEKLSFKLSLLTKSLNQRMQAKHNYDRTIKEIEENYSSLVQESGKLLAVLSKEVHDLEELMDKKTGTGGSLSGEVPDSKDRVKKTPSKGRTSTDSPPPEVEANPIIEDVEVANALKDTSPATSKRSSILSEQEMHSHKSQTSNHSSLRHSNHSSPRHSDRRFPANSPRHSTHSTDTEERTRDIVKTPQKPTFAPQSDPVTPKMYLEKPPPIKKGGSIDIELQSYREAYERQHKGGSPPHSMNGLSTSGGEKYRRGSAD